MPKKDEHLNEYHTLPFKEIKDFAVRTQLREGATHSGREIYFIRFAKLKVNPDYNGRITTLEIGMDELVADITANGLEEPLWVDYDVKGNAWIDRGHRRYRALCIMNEQGLLKKMDKKGIRNGLIECFINRQYVNPLDKLCSQYRSNNRGVPFNDQEVALLCFKLHNPPFSIQPQQIADKLHISRGSVNNYLLLAGIKQESWDAIAEGVTTPTAVVAAVRVLQSPDQVDQEIQNKKKANKKFTVGDASLLKKQSKEAEEEMNPEMKFEEEVDDDTLLNGEEGRGAADGQWRPVGEGLYKKPEPEIEEKANKPKSVKSKEDIKFDVTREEIVWSNNIITQMDKVMTMIEKSGLSEQDKRDMTRLLDFCHTDMEKLRTWVHKNGRS